MDNTDMTGVGQDIQWVNERLRALESRVHNKKEDTISGLQMVGLGLVADDKQEDNWHIPVYLLEQLPAETSELQEVDTHTSTVTDSNGQVTSINLKRGKNVTARWLGLGQSGRHTPPSVRKGEEVILFKRPGSIDMYFWEICATEYDRRRQEKHMIAINDTAALGNQDLGKMYYHCMDTINKSVRTHYADSDGEYCTYDLDYNTKTGHILWVDGHNNFIEWDSPSSTMHFKTNSHITLSAIGKDQLHEYTDSHNFENSYHYDIDNFKMHIREYLPRAVGKEQSMYRRILDGMNGKYRFEDDHGNWEELNSVVSDFSSNIEHNVTKRIGNDKSERIENDSTIFIGNNETVQIGNNRAEQIGNNNTQDVGADKTVTVGGNFTLQVQGNLTIKVGGKFSIEGDGGADVHTGGDLNIASDGNTYIN